MTDQPKIGPREIITRKLVCDGCPELKVEDWTDHDIELSGKTATCAAKHLTITMWWKPENNTPSWCPALKEKTT